MSNVCQIYFNEMNDASTRLITSTNGDHSDSSPTPGDVLPRAR